MVYLAKSTKIFQGNIFEIFEVKVKKFKQFLKKLHVLPTCDFLTFCHDAAIVALYCFAKIHSLSSSNKLSREMRVFGLSRFFANFAFFEHIEVAHSYLEN